MAAAVMGCGLAQSFRSARTVEDRFMRIPAQRASEERSETERPPGITAETPPEVVDAA